MKNVFRHTKCERKSFLRLAKMKRKNGSQNKTKKRALEVLENGIPIDGPTFAHRVGIHPVRRVYAYLAHLAALGLIVRRAGLGSKLFFQITERGLERLKWLRAQDKPSALEELLLPILWHVPMVIGRVNAVDVGMTIQNRSKPSRSGASPRDNGK
jgi:hypothetical protein